MAGSTRERLEQFLVDVVEERDKSLDFSLGVRVLRRFLLLLSFLYGSLIQLRHALYRAGVFRHHTLGCQVISVGNLTVGGTGKTPVVEAFARELHREGRTTAILSRGYKKKADPLGQRIRDRLWFWEPERAPRVVSDGTTLLLDSAMSGDEPYMLASNLPGVRVLVDKDRVKSGRYAIAEFGCDTLILDDGFQYLALRHRLEIVLVDRTNPFGNGRVLPRGLLREPVSNIRRANVIFITKSDGTGTEDLRASLRKLNEKAEIIECRHAARHLRNVYTREILPLEHLQGLPVYVLSGIAAPEGFEREVATRGALVQAARRFADHHRYTRDEILGLVAEAREAGAQAIVTTEKDAVRLPALEACELPVYFVRVDIEILSGAEDFRACIARICFR